MWRLARPPDTCAVTRRSTHSKHCMRPHSARSCDPSAARAAVHALFERVPNWRAAPTVPKRPGCRLRRVSGGLAARGRSESERARRCVRSGRQHTCSRCMPTWISAPRACRGSRDPLQPFWSCPRLTCGDGDPTEEEMGSKRVDWAHLQKKVIDAMPTADDAGLAARGGSDRHDT